MQPLTRPPTPPYVPPDLLIDATQSPHALQLGREVEGNVSYVASMGTTGILYLPSAFCESMRNLSKAIRNFDVEAKIESAIRMFDIPFGIAYALQRITIFLLLILKGLVIFALNVASYIVGGVFVAIELFLECFRLYHLISFRSELSLDRTLFLIRALQNADVATLQTHRAELEANLNRPYVEAHMSKLDPNRPRKILCEGMMVSLLYKKLFQIRRTYFQNENVDALRGQLNSLARKIRPWLVRDLQRELPFLIEKIQTFDTEAIDRSIELLETIETQTTKARNMYIVGIIALSIAIILFGISFVLAPYLTPILIVAGLIGTSMEFGRWFAPESYLDQKDNSWNWDPWLPNCLKRGKEIQPYSKDPMVELRVIKV